MRKLAIAAVMLASCTLAVAEENSESSKPEQAKSGNWFTRLWSGSEKPAPKKAAVESKKIEPTAEELVARQRDREMSALNRRKEVILKLREIAVCAHDDALLSKVDQLEERAWNLYLAATSGCLGSAVSQPELCATKDDGVQEGQR